MVVKMRKGLYRTRERLKRREKSYGGGYILERRGIGLERSEGWREMGWGGGKGVGEEGEDFGGRERAEEGKGLEKREGSGRWKGVGEEGEELGGGKGEGLGRRKWDLGRVKSIPLKI